MIKTPFLQKICRITGVMLAILSMALTGMYGLSKGVVMALALVTISFMASYIWPIVFELSQTRNGWTKPLTFVGIGVACLLTVADVLTNASSSGAIRSQNIHEATVQTTAAEVTKQKLEDARASLKLFQKRLEELKWTGAVTADGLRAQLPAMDEAIRQESRRGGCGPKCLALQERKASIEADIARMESGNDIAAKMEATKKLIAKYSDEVKATPRGFSAAMDTNTRLAALLTVDRRPGEDAVYWVGTYLVVLLGALVTIASQFFNLLGWAGSSPMQSLRDALKGDEPEADPLPKPGTFGHLAMPVSVPQIAPAAQAQAPQVGFIPQPAKAKAYVIETQTMADLLSSKEWLAARRSGMAAA